MATLFGKHFASMYSGSMFGKPAVVFAVWGYAIAHMRPARGDGSCFVELNPVLLAATFSSEPETILEAIKDLCSPDERSRSQGEDGKRLVPVDEGWHHGPAQYRVVNGPKYRALRDEEERRIYLREAKRKERVNKVVDSQPVSTVVNRGKPRSTQVEVEEEVEVEAGRKEAPLPPALPPADRAERSIREKTVAMQTKLYGLIDAMVREDPRQRDPTELMRLVTGYEKDGRKVKGVVNAAMLTFERLEKSIEDAQATLLEWRKKGNGTGKA